MKRWASSVSTSVYHLVPKKGTTSTTPNKARCFAKSAHKPPLSQGGNNRPVLLFEETTHHSAEQAMKDGAV